MLSSNNSTSLMRTPKMKVLYDNPNKEKPDTISCDRLYISPERIALFEDNACIKSISLNDVIMITDNQIESPLENVRNQ